MEWPLFALLHLHTPMDDESRFREAGLQWSP